MKMSTMRIVMGMRKRKARMRIMMGMRKKKARMRMVMRRTKRMVTMLQLTMIPMTMTMLMRMSVTLRLLPMRTIPSNKMSGVWQVNLKIVTFQQKVSQGGYRLVSDYYDHIGVMILFVCDVTSKRNVTFTCDTNYSCDVTFTSCRLIVLYLFCF